MRQSLRKMLEMRWGQRPVGAMLSVLEAIAEKVDHEQILGGNYDVWLKDLDDHPGMATALACRVDYLVTWNTKDFPPKETVCWDHHHHARRLSASL